MDNGITNNTLLPFLPQVKESEVAIGGGGDKGEVSANELLCSQTRHRPELLLRQHSMPATFHESLATNPKDSSPGVYMGTAAGDDLGNLNVKLPSKVG